jgi:hypothetical protein
MIQGLNATFTAFVIWFLVHEKRVRTVNTETPFPYNILSPQTVSPPLTSFLPPPTASAFLIFFFLRQITLRVLLILFPYTPATNSSSPHPHIMKFTTAILPIAAIFVVSVSSIPIRRDIDPSLIPNLGFQSGTNPFGECL